MSLRCEYLPATVSAQQDLVLLHGWGCNREVWRALLALLRPWANITVLDIPGLAPEASMDAVPALSDVLADIVQHAPDEAVYVGWSLGGQLATALAAEYPQRVLALITICSNPLFVADGDWPGMDAVQFHAFVDGMSAAPVAGLKRFDALQARGARRARALLRQLQSMGRGAASTGLMAGLHWLETLDLRAALAALQPPQLHLLAAEDALVPREVSACIEAQTAAVPTVRVNVLANASHLAPLDMPETLADEIHAFLGVSDLLLERSTAATELEKASVAASFSRAAAGYDSVAGLQRDVGKHLLSYLDEAADEPARVLDLGCGTGHFCPALRARYPGAQYLGLDLAVGMVDYARRRYPTDTHWLVGDAESLPLASDSIDIAFSSLAVQWCSRPRHLFAELSRVLRPGGMCVFTSLGPDTLQELRHAWATVDSHQHVNTFTPAAELVGAAQGIANTQLVLQQQVYRMEYERVRDLLDELKTLGAHNMNRSRPAGLTSRRALQGMLQAYELKRSNGLLPATYDVIFGVFKKL